MAWNDGIFAALVASTPLVALVPVSQIWYDEAPPNVSVPGKKTLPNITFWSVGGTSPQYNAPALPGSQYIEELQFQVDIYCEGMVEKFNNRQIAQIIDQLLNLRRITIDTGLCMRIMRTSTLETLILEPKASPNDVDVQHTPLIYQYMIQRTL